MKLIAMLFVFCLSQVLHGQRVLIGSTSDEVAAAYGPPLGFFWRGTTYTTEPVTSEPVYVVYRQKDNLNEYEFRIFYRLDNSESRLHPTARVQNITLLTDKPIRARNMIERLGWAKDFCSPKCRVQRLIPGEQLLLTRKTFFRPLQTWALQIFMNEPSGAAIQNAMRDLDSDATVFILSPYDFSGFPLTRNVKGDWIP